MKLFVAITDYQWFAFLASEERVEEVNFWRPSSESGFRALQPGELFLFKLHAPRNYIVGGGFFIRFLQTSVSLAWRAFGRSNGTASLEALRERIATYGKASVTTARDPVIGCILLGEPFFFTEGEWIPTPPDFSSNIVQGKGYDLTSTTGQHLWQEVRARLERQVTQEAVAGPATGAVLEGPRFGSPVAVAPRLGQGAFRLLVTDIYSRRCAVTQERALPVLEAAHIRPYSEGGEHSLTNGILLRSDLHRLLDSGYMTIDPNDRTIVVSRRLKEEFDNGRDYYPFQGRRPTFPSDLRSTPSKENLLYHAEKIFR